MSLQHLHRTTEERTAWRRATGPSLRPAPHTLVRASAAPSPRSRSLPRTSNTTAAAKTSRVPTLKTKMVDVPAAIPQRSTSTSGRCCRRPSCPKPHPWAAHSPLLASKATAMVARGRAPLASRLAPPSPRSHRWWCHPSCWTATQRWVTPSRPADSTRPTTLPPNYKAQNWVPTAPCRVVWPSRTPSSTPPPSGPRTPGLFSFRCPRRSPSCRPPSPLCACRPRTGAPSVTPPSAWPQTWFTTCDPITKRSTPWSLWSSGGARRNSSAPFAMSPSGSGITCHVTWPPITDFHRLTREGLFFLIWRDCDLAWI